MIRQLFPALYFILFFSSSSEGAKYYVPKDFSTIQKAIDNCRVNDSVILSPGKYTGDGNRDIVFKGKRVILRSVNPDDPNVVKSTVIDCEGSQDMRHCAFNLHDNGPYSPIIAGLTVTGASQKDDYGSCVRAYGGNVILLNCRFIENIGTSVLVYHCNAVIRNCEFSSNTGAGIKLIFDSSAEVANCTIADNKKGGININNCAARITGCQILDNYNTYDGGGIRIESDDVVVKDCHIKNNKTAKSGGGCYVRSGEWIIEDCVIEGNFAKKDGGGIKGIDVKNNGLIKNSKIISNTAEGEGGGIARFKGLVSGCRIQNNTAKTKSGGGIAHCEIIDKCMVSGNQAATGGGIYGASIIQNCLIYCNSASKYPCAGYFDQMVNCTVIKNTCTEENRYSRDGTVVKNCIIRDNVGSSLKLYTNILYSNIDFKHAGITNINSDPFFVDAQNDNYHLKSNSPCIDAGDLDDEYNNEPEPNGERINIGAYGNTSEAATKRGM